MVTFSVTIDKESNRELFLQIMKELKFVISVRPLTEEEGLNALELSLPGENAKDKELEDLLILSEEGESYQPEESKIENEQRFDAWQHKKNK